MEAHKSPLILNNFLLLNLEYHFIQPQAEMDINIPETTNQYFIDIDFAFQGMADELVQLFTKIGINNNDNVLPGYQLFIEGVCAFSFDSKEELTEIDISNLLHLSGLNICINSLRNIIATITANGPFGKYTLPSINVNQLLADKQVQMAAKA
ncbi:MAG: hypothetical protein WCX31_01450 [Salinivirgaceae bacterium]|jgi:preprotein translocase subunit SecB